jgi:hypothetical protein
MNFSKADCRDGIVWKMEITCLNVRVGKHQIVFGKGRNIEDKMNRLKIFYKKMWNDEVLKTYLFLNVKYKNQVIGSY